MLLTIHHLGYDVAGFRTLAVTIAVPSNAANASGNSAAVQSLSRTASSGNGEDVVLANAALVR